MLFASGAVVYRPSIRTGFAQYVLALRKKRVIAGQLFRM